MFFATGMPPNKLIIKIGNLIFFRFTLSSIFIIFLPIIIMIFFHRGKEILIIFNLLISCLINGLIIFHADAMEVNRHSIIFWFIIVFLYHFAWLLIIKLINIGRCENVNKTLF